MGVKSAVRKCDKEVQADGHEGYIEHELAVIALRQLDAIKNATSPEHKAAAKVPQGTGRPSHQGGGK